MIRVFMSSPLLVVFTIASAVVLAMTFAGYARRGGFWSPEVEARVFDQKGRPRKAAGAAASGGQRTFAFQGEVYRDAERLREASSLAAAGALLAAQRSLDRRPVTGLEGLLASLVQSGLMPPGMRVDQSQSAVESESGLYYVRYRVEPLALEVVSIGKGSPAGPPLLVRLPDDEFSQNGLTYYVAPRVELTQMPGAFTPTAQIINAGWKPVTYKAAPVSADERERQREWLAKEAAPLDK